MKSTLMRSLLLVLLAALLLTLAVGCGEIDEDEIPENMHSVTLDGSYCRLVVPIDWNAMTDMGVTGAYISSQNYASIFVHDYENPDGLSPADYADQVYMAEIGAAYPEGEVGAITKSEDTLDGKTACVLEYTGTRELITYRSRVYLCAHRDRIYALSYITQMDLFDGYLPTLDNVLVNFRFLDEPWVSGEKHNTVDTGADAPDGMMLASNDDVAYRFYVPNTWVLDTALPTSSAYVSEADRTNVNVTVYMPRESASIEDYWKTCEQELQAAVSDYTFISSEETKLDGRVAYTYTYSAKINGTLYRFAQTIATWRGMFYTVTYTALDETFDSHRADYEAILAAFEFRGN